MSEKGKDEDGFKRKTGRLQGYSGSGRTSGGKRGTRMNVEAAGEKLKSLRMEERGGEKRGRAEGEERQKEAIRIMDEPMNHEGSRKKQV